MDTLSLLWDGILTSVTPTNIGLLALGVLMGMVVGAVPGIGPSAGIAILLPITMDLDPVAGIIMLAAVYYGAMYGGTITSVLVNVPGDAGSVVATFDGHPLAKLGRAGPALVMAAAGSFVAGTVGTVLIVLTAPPLSALASRLGPAEIFLIIITGLLTIVVVLGRRKLLGLISVLAGFAIGTVGVDLGGQQRYTFGLPDLTGGIDLVIVVIGVFGVGEMLHSLYRGDHVGPVEHIRFTIRSRSFWPTRTDVLESQGPIARGSILGFVVGAIPGAGAVLASFMSYGVEKAVSRRPETFGKGALPGLVGPETANNGASTGALVPLLTMGIPGSGSTAVLLTGFLMWGLQPGPLLMEQNPEFAWGLIASMYVGNVMLLLLNVFCIPLFANIARTPLTVIAPAVILLCVLGTYVVHGSLFEVGLMLAFGVLGLAMRIYGFSAAALVIALVLGGEAEHAFRQTMVISGGDLGIFLDRAPSRVILAVIAALLVALLVVALRKRRRAAEPASVDAAAPGD
ncbi:tripartite tricarboxylate transporter permease [Pseudonocardia adelaidensis]|uniref:Tripartite tricarboxylate transporter permease n=1 Tax=Pseudonocardia adelaidensis TaxID=648754 RepID=A0ABP9NLC5_9PSEU